jgi:hypothetical protein
MSLNKFLVVGKSFADVPEGKSPFEMRAEVQLPRFENEPRFTTKQPVMVQADWLAEKEHRVADPKGAARPKKIVKARRRISWLRILTFGLFGRKEKFTGHLVQEEMPLQNVRVMRNDLADSDLEVVVNKRKKFALRAVKAEVPAQTEAPKVEEPAEKTRVCTQSRDPRSSTRPKRYEWSELTMRLFDIGQH